MYCTSLEPKRGLSHDADLGILTTIKYTLPQAKSLYDIGVRVMSAADITRARLADFNSMIGGSVWRHPSRFPWQWDIRAQSFRFLSIFGNKFLVFKYKIIGNREFLIKGDGTLYVSSRDNEWCVEVHMSYQAEWNNLPLFCSFFKSGIRNIQTTFPDSGFPWLREVHDCLQDFQKTAQSSDRWLNLFPYTFSKLQSSVTSWGEILSQYHFF